MQFSDMRKYVEQGLSVFPLLPRDKRPYTDLLPIEDGRHSWEPFQHRAPNDEELDNWEGSGQAYNIALACGAVSGVVVLDADGEKAVEFCRRHRLTSPVRVKTGKGYHYYFRHPGTPVGNRGKMFGRADLQLRADGGYVVLPPSVHPSGARYEWEIDPGCDWSDMPAWDDRRHIIEVTEENAGEFSLSSLNLQDVVPEGASVWAEVAREVAELGKFDGRAHTGRNNWLTRYVGELVRKGLDDNEIRGKIVEFEGAFFSVHLPDQEKETILRSIRERDRKADPEAYDPNTGTRSKTEPAPDVYTDSRINPPDQETPAKIPGLVRVKELLEKPPEIRNYLIEPWLPEPSIAQVYGYFSHGKSMVTAAAMWCLALGRNFGPWKIRSARKVLYLDYDMGKRDIYQRIASFHKAFGDPGDNFTLLAESFADEGFSIDPRTEVGLRNLESAINAVNPQVVVLDNVRTIMPGMDENDSKSWSRLNEIVKQMRNAGMTVVMLHHANKPKRADSGGWEPGQEAGSGNQLTVIETQIRVSLLPDDQPEWNDLADQLREGERIRHPVKITYGKVRDRDPELHEDTFLAFTRKSDGSMGVVHKAPKRQMASILRLGRGPTGKVHTPQEIAQELHVSEASVLAWLAEAGLT
jgi:hypothetical protein